MAGGHVEYNPDDSPADDQSLLLGGTLAGGDRAKIRHNLVCDFEFWVSYDPDFTIYPGDNMYMLRMHAPAQKSNKASLSASGPNASSAYDTSGSNTHDPANAAAWGGGGAWGGGSSYTDLVKNDRSDTESDGDRGEARDAAKEKKTRTDVQPKLSSIDVTEHAKHDLSGKILWFLTNQDSNITYGRRERGARGVGGTDRNFRKLHESDRFWTLFSLFLFSVLVIVVLVVYNFHSYWWVVLIAFLVFLAFMILLNRRYKSGYNEYYNNRMFELIKLCNKLNEHENGFYKECFFELFSKHTMGVVACCSNRQYQRKAIIRVTPAMYTKT